MSPDQLDQLRLALAGRYTLERELGAGGMATVFLAEDLKHGRPVAIKVLKPELAATLGADRFVREISIAAQLTHPHILPLHDSGDANGFLYYVMPYIAGESLRQCLERSGPLTVDQAVRVTEQVASALTHAHERGVVHRDIKPENILLAGDQAIVADFGIARAVEAAGGATLTGTGLAIGTPAYMSPEQAFDQQSVDGRSDVYSLGCVLYEMVAGAAPFTGDTPQALMAQHAAATVPQLGASRPGIPLFVERAAAKAMAKLPDDRFHTPGALAEALTSQLVVARVGGRRGRRTALAGIAVLGLGVATWAVLSLGGPAGVERLAVLPFANRLNDPDQEYLVQGMHEAVISELAQAGLKVIARPSVMRYAGTDKSGREIARELEVGVLVEGSAYRSGDSVGIRVSLIDGQTEEYVWAGAWDTDMTNVLALYRDVAGAIVSEIRGALPAGIPGAALAKPVNPQAYQLLLRAHFHADQFMPRHLDAAEQYFQQALELEPGFAAAHAGVGRVWGQRIVIGIAPPLEVGPKWLAAAERAVQLDSTLGEAWAELAQSRTWYAWDWQGAAEAFERAVEIDPNDPGTRSLYSHFLTGQLRHDEAARHAARALELDPFNPFIRALIGIQRLFAGQWDDGVALIRESIDMAPDLPLAHYGLAGAYELRDEMDEALLEMRTFYDLLGAREIVAVIDSVLARGTTRDAARAAAERLAARARTTFVKPMQVIALYNQAGETDKVFEWMERAYEERDHDMVYLAVIPLSRAVTTDPRYRAMLLRMRLPAT